MRLSLVLTTPLAASVNQPSSWNRTVDGGLNGIGMANLRTSSTPGDPSISTTCVGSMRSVWPPIRPPFNFSIVIELLTCAVSINARNEPVNAAAKPPIKCGIPIPYAPRHGINLYSTIQSSFFIFRSPASQLRYNERTLPDNSSTVRMYGARPPLVILSSSTFR